MQEMTNIQNQQYARYAMMKLTETIKQADYIKKHPYLNGFIAFTVNSENDKKICLTAEGYYYDSISKKIMRTVYDDNKEDKDNFIFTDLLDKDTINCEIFLYYDRYGRIDLDRVLSLLKEENGKQPLVENVKSFRTDIVNSGETRHVDLELCINQKTITGSYKSFELTSTVKIESDI